ncbi:MAG: twin-arginine translocase subunit TatC [Candidatus Omnitrophica bacterium]|nr:twin-arginine translocase subunit TatC [Candidatus Omnitrophota bacterium]
MSAFCPEEPKKLDIVSHLEEFRKRILISLGVLAGASIFTFSRGDSILSIVTKPVLTLVPELIYIGPAEAFTAYLTTALLSGFILGSPFFLYQAWAFIAPAISRGSRRRAAAWFLSAMLLFIAGIAFSYYLAIPGALKFLLNFGAGVATPRITLGRYISFFAALILAGGVVFEIPVAMGLLTDTGLINTRTLRRKRPHAMLGILIFAAVITPTQDIVNMLMFALPMALLYEAGLLLARGIERGKRSGNAA